MAGERHGHGMLCMNRPLLSQVCMWYFYHAIALGYDFPLLLFCFRLSFINLIRSFLPPTSLMWVFFCVSLSHRLEFLRSRRVTVQLHWPSHSLPPNQLLQPYWLTPYYWDIFTTHTLPHIYSVLGLQPFFWILEPWVWDREFVPKRR